MVTIEFTKDEAEHMKQLMGKEIGWQIKHKVGKEEICRSIYGKIAQGLDKIKPEQTLLPIQ